MLWSIIIASVVLYLLWLLWNDKNHPLDKVPGPKRYPIIGATLVFMKATPHELFVSARKFAATYGQRYMVKIMNRRILGVYRPEEVEQVLAHTRNITKSIPYRFLQPWLGTGLLLSTGNKWHRRRKILTPTFHFNILKSFVIVMEEKSQNLVEKLRATQGQELDVYPLISDATLFAICETAMGTQLDKDKSTSTMEYKKAILAIGNYLLDRLTRVWLHNDYIFQMSPLGRQFEKIKSKVHSFCDDVILERKRKRIESNDMPVETDDVGTKKRMAMLDLLLEAESKGEIDLEGIREEVNTFMFEGHDTTATALSFAVMLLADHEEIQEKVYKEIEEVLGDVETPTMAELGELKYLEAVVKEVLRLYPSVPFIARNIIEDFMIDDILVPAKNSEVAVHIYDLHRQPDLYPNPDVFDPQRFLDGTQRHPYAYVPFSAGLRNCIGQRYAMLEMKSMLAAIVRNFTLVPRKKGWRPKLISDLVLRSAEPIYVKFIPRK